MSFFDAMNAMNGTSNMIATMSSITANQQRAEMANQQAEMANQQSRDTKALRREQAKTNALLEKQVEMENEKNRIAQEKLAAEAKERQDTLEFRNLLRQSNTLLSLMKSRIH